MESQFTLILFDIKKDGKKIFFIQISAEKDFSYLKHYCIYLYCSPF